jgi:hypothetical protein
MNRSRLLFALKLLFTVALLAAVVYYVDLSDVWRRLAAINPLWVLASIGTLAFGYVLCGLRWAWMARGLGLAVSRRRKVRLYFLGMFASLFLPSTIGGDVVRGILLAKSEGRSGIGLLAGASVVLDRVNGLYALVLLLSICLLFFDWPATMWFGWGMLLLAMWGGLLFYPWLHARLPQKLARLQALPLHQPVFQRMWWQSMPVSFVFQVLVVQAHFFLGMAVGLDMAWPAYAVMIGMVALMAILPISLNGFGVREAGYVGFAVYFGGSGDAATAMAALWVIVLAITALPGGWVLWRLGGLRAVRRETATDADQA